MVWCARTGAGAGGMWRAALAALSLAGCARGGGGEQYGGGAMPQYGAADYEHEYRARSPDAPASLDYKYQEVLRDSENPARETEETDRWQKAAGRAQRRLVRDDPEEEMELESKALEAEARSGRRRKRRGRARWDEVRRETPAPRRRPRPAHAALADRSAVAGDSRRDRYLDSIDYRDDENKYVVDNERIATTETTAKILGRKPRQRVFAPPPLNVGVEPTATTNPNEFLLDEDEEKNNHPMRGEVKDDSDYSSGEEGDRAGAAAERARATLPSVERESGPVSDKEDAMREWGPPKSAVSYSDYNEYSHTNKNLENIRNRLPTLLRRPTPSTTERPRKPTWAGRPRPWQGRRAGQLGVVPLEEPPAPRPTEPSGPTTAPPSGPATELSAASGTTTTAAAATTAPATANETSSTTYAPVAFVPSAKGSEPSMADKSRLSILKKAQLKESPARNATRKPPVLLQVTARRVPTVVMVAPAPGAGDPWLRAREVAGDSPATLDKVKRIMRQKLVSGAKSIRELTDNWDDTICDYVDVGLLDSMPDAARPPVLAHARLAPACALALLLLM